jgi:hypothetical protein
MAEDPALSSASKEWVYQVLADITHEPLGHNAATWREWWFAHQQH